MPNLLSTVNKPKTNGFTLIEVLVGLIILAIGLLGLAGLQMKALRHNNDAYHRSQATLLAYDIMDRMRANRDKALDGDYDIGFGEEPSQNLTMADTDLASWMDALHDNLPGPGEGKIAMDGTLVTVSIRWNEARIDRGEAEDEEEWKDRWMRFETESEL